MKQRHVYRNEAVLPTLLSNRPRYPLEKQTADARQWLRQKAHQSTKVMAHVEVVNHPHDAEGPNHR